MYMLSEDEDSEFSSSSQSSGEKKTYFEEPEASANEKTTIKLDDVTLEKLIDKIRNIVNIPSKEIAELDDDQRIKRFFIDPEINFTYFVKNNYTVNVDETNFLQNIFFGKVDVHFERTLLMKLNYVFTFSIYCMKQTPYHIRMQSTKKLETFSYYLAESFYKHFGLNKIHIPALTLISEPSPTFFANTTDILNLYEDFIILWCKQINNAISDEEMDYQYLREFSPLILDQFWKYKWFNLKQIMDYVKDGNSIKMYNFLEEHNSAHTTWIYELRKQLEYKIDEIESNVSFLQVMKQIFGLVEENSIKSLPSLFPDMFLYMNIISESSKYFGLIENKILLITSVTQQIINVCKRKFRAECIFISETEESMDCLVDSVLTCCLYKETLRQVYGILLLVETLLLKFNFELEKLYKRMRKPNFIAAEIFSIFFNDEIFGSIAVTNSTHISNVMDMFVYRCVDMLDICSLINIFSNLANEQNDKQMKIEYCLMMKEHTQRILNMFACNLDQFRTIQCTIFEFQNNDWFTYNHRFQNQMNEINFEVMQKVEEIFQYVSTFADAIDVLRITYQYSKSHRLRYFFAQKHDVPRNMVIAEINNIKKNLLRAKINSTNGNSLQTIYVASCFQKKRRMQFLFKLLKKCRWLIQRESTVVCQQQYEKTVADINEFVINEYKKWLEKYQTSVLKRLKRPLIKNCFHRNGLLEVNIDKRLLRIIKEAHNWIQIGFIPSPNMEKLLNLTPSIMTLLQNVKNLVFAYNRIFINLVSDEQTLHFRIVKQCYNIIRPTLTLYWDLETSNKIVIDCTKQIQKIENVVNDYKNRSNQIIELSKSICLLQMPTSTRTTLEEIKEETETASIMFLKKLLTYFKKITIHLHTTFDSFKNNIGEMKRIWNSYINKTDSLLKCALLHCVKNNLHNFIEKMVPDLEYGRVVMKVQFCVEVIGKELVYHPNVSDVRTFFSSFGLRILNAIKLIPRIFNEFKYKKNSKKLSYAKELMQNDEIIYLQERINIVIANHFDELKICMQFWDPYRPLWEMDGESCIRNKRKTLFDVKDYNQLFSSYTYKIKQMELKNNFEKVLLFELNTSKLRLEVIKQCENRIRYLSEVVKLKAREIMKDVDQQIDSRLNELSSFNFKSDDYTTFMKNMFMHATCIEKQIQQICDLIFLLRGFLIAVEKDIEKQQKISESKWQNFKNTIERCRLKVKAIHGVIF